MTRMAHNAERLPPIHPGEILNEEFLLPMNLTQYRLAKAIGVDPRRIHSIVHGERSITPETALLFSRALHQKYLVLLNHPSTSSGRTDFHTYARGEPVEP